MALDLASFGRWTRSANAAAPVCFTTLDKLRIDQKRTSALMNTHSPARIMEVGMAFWPAKVLLSAVELGIFTALGAGSMTGRELQDALRLHQRANPDLFDTLVALRFLNRDGTGPEARYQNTEETALFLDRKSPQFMGGFLEMANARLYRFWGNLSDALRTGSPKTR
jgi:hypothetical protein